MMAHLLGEQLVLAKLMQLAWLAWLNTFWSRLFLARQVSSVRLSSGEPCKAAFVVSSQDEMEGGCTDKVPKDNARPARRFGCAKIASLTHGCTMHAVLNRIQVAWVRLESQTRGP